MPHGLERVGEVFDGRRFPIVGPDDGDDVEAAPHIKNVIALLELDGRDREPPLFLKVNGLDRRAVPPRFYLDKHQGIAIACDQVDFAKRSAISADQDAQAFTLQESRCGPLGSAPNTRFIIARMIDVLGVRPSRPVPPLAGGSVNSEILFDITRFGTPRPG